MARTRAAPSASRSHAAPHAAPPPAAKKAEPMHQSPPHQQQTHAQTAPTPQQPSVTNVYVQRPGYGGGAGSGMLGTMAAVAGGSVIGHGISNYLYSNNNQAPTQPAEAQQLAQAAAQENNVCASHITGYSKCLEANPDSADNCKWAWDYFMQCQREHPSTPAQ